MQNMLRTIIRLFLQLPPCPSKTAQFCRPEASESELQERLHFLWSHWCWLSQATKIWWQFLHPFASGHNCRVGNIRHHRVWERCSFSSGSQQGTFWTHLLWLKTDSPFRCRPCSRGRTCRQRGPWRSSSWTRSFGALFSHCWSAWVWGLSCQQMKGTKWFSWQALYYFYLSIFCRVYFHRQSFKFCKLSRQFIPLCIFYISGFAGLVCKSSLPSQDWFHIFSLNFQLFVPFVLFNLALVACFFRMSKIISIVQLANLAISTCTIKF